MSCCTCWNFAAVGVLITAPFVPSLHQLLATGVSKLPDKAGGDLGDEIWVLVPDDCEYGFNSMVLGTTSGPQ